MMEGSGRAPGDFSFDPFDLYFGRSEKVQKDMVIKELKNGRLAHILSRTIITKIRRRDILIGHTDRCRRRII